MAHVYKCTKYPTLFNQYFLYTENSLIRLIPNLSNLGFSLIYVHMPPMLYDLVLSYNRCFIVYKHKAFTCFVRANFVGHIY